MSDLRDFSTTEQLRNGLSVTLRAVRPDDKARLVAAFRELEPESIYTRYFHHKKSLTPDDLKDMTEVDFINEIIFVVTISRSGEEIIIGRTRYDAYQAEDGASVAEIAFTVEEDYHGLGIASRLLRHLIRIGRERGLARFQADVLPTNRGMLAVFAKSGLPMKIEQEEDTLHVTLSLAT